MEQKKRKKVLNRWRFFSIEFVYDFSSFHSPWGGLEIVMNFGAISLIPLGSARSTKAEQKEPPGDRFCQSVDFALCALWIEDFPYSVLRI